MPRNDFLVTREIERLQGFDDETFAAVLGGISDRPVDMEERINDDLVHITEIKDEINKVHDTWGKISGLSTGFASLDCKIGGLRKGEVTLIGGETSSGKSALATNIATNVSKEHTVLFITLEMLQAEIGARIQEINGGTIDDLDMVFQKEYRITYNDLKPLLERAQQEANIELVVLDYMQYLGRGMKLEEVAKMSKEIKSLALKHQIPFIVIVSLRKGDAKFKRKWTEIEIEDFMGTSAIGYDCDIGIITSRRDVDDNFNVDKIYLKVLKTRNMKLDWNDRYLEMDWLNTKITDNNWIEPVEKVD